MTNTNKKYTMEWTLQQFIKFYADKKNMQIEKAKDELIEYGAIDYSIRMSNILGHARPEQIANRLDTIVNHNRELRKSYGMELRH